MGIQMMHPRTATAMGQKATPLDKWSKIRRRLRLLVQVRLPMRVQVERNPKMAIAQMEIVIQTLIIHQNKINPTQKRENDY